MSLPPDVLSRIVGLAARAPSAHNAQPARWRFRPDGRVVLFEDRRRRLTVGDPTGRDARIGLGAAFEGLHLCLGRRGLGLGPPGPSADTAEAPPGLARVAEADLTEVDRADPLAELVAERRTYRGTFLPADAADRARLAEVLGAAADVQVVQDAVRVDEIARLNDACALSFLSRPEYQEELYGWIRFSPRDPAWDRDGLTADCLGMSAPERALARHLFRPGAFRALHRLGLAAPLASEEKQVRSATAIVILLADVAADDLAAGRRFHRLLLELCGAGFAACPMSALADSERGRDWLRERGLIPQGRRPVNVFRVGRAPEGRVARSPRLPPEELLV